MQKVFEEGVIVATRNGVPRGIAVFRGKYKVIRLKLINGIKNQKKLWGFLYTLKNKRNCSKILYINFAMKQNYRVLLTAGNTVEYFKNARTRSLTNIDIMISIIPGSVFKVKKIIIVSKINRFKFARIEGWS